MRSSLVYLLFAFVALPLAAQKPDAQKPAGPEGEVPPGWEVRLDQPDPNVKISADQEKADIWFVTMTPGWHVTTKPAGIFYHPASVAQGDFRATTTIHLFDPGRRNEAYGLFFGGQNLQEDNQTYLYFLIRRSGEFLVKQRNGSSTSVLTNWTAHPAILKYEADTEGPVENTLSVAVRGQTIDFYINDQKVADLARGNLQTDGTVGLRLNHSVNVHISDLKVE